MLHVTIPVNEPYTSRTVTTDGNAEKGTHSTTTGAKEEIMDTVAIIINSYKNYPPYLDTAIKSCLSQEGVKVRLIISTVDGDPAEAQAKAIDKNIIVVKRPTPGIYEQLNNALPAIGDAQWYHYFSGNDYMEPYKNQIEIATAIAQDKKICYSNYWYTNKFLRCDPPTRLTNPYNYAKHLAGNYTPDWSIIRTDILKKYAPFQERLGNYAYWDFWLRVTEGEGNIYAFNPKPAVRYRIVPTSKHILRRKNKAEKARYLRVRNAMLAEHRNKVIPA
jgi:glycosyltransferase involved in cell wall biosynthesis